MLRSSLRGWGNRDDLSWRRAACGGCGRPRLKNAWVNSRIAEVVMGQDYRIGRGVLRGIMGGLCMHNRALGLRMRGHRAEAMRTSENTPSTSLGELKKAVALGSGFLYALPRSHLSRGKPSHTASARLVNR